jgi:hypothetical protein
MVTRITCSGAGSRTLLWLAALCVIGMGSVCPRQVQAQEATLFFLTAKGGQQDVGGSLFNTLQATHGHLLDSKTVDRAGFDLDIYAVTRSKFGLAIGLEVMQFAKTFSFQDPTGVQTPEQLHLDGRSFLYTLKAFARYGDFLPFFGIGTGTYYLSYNERVSKLSFLDVATDVFSYRAGFRWLLAGRWGMLAEYGEISAPLRVQTNNTTSTLQLGGTFWNAGISYVW